jgi:predicted KAP-like P-loop ATPase
MERDVETDGRIPVEADRPLEDPGEDLLGYSELARRLARLISFRESQDSLVIAVMGPWGSGKSTVLNFIEAYLNDSKETPEDRRPIIVHFNPWWFQGSQHLLQHFLGYLMDALREFYGTTDPRKVLPDRVKQALRQIGLFAELLSDLPLPHPLENLLRTLSKLSKPHNNSETPETPERRRRRINDLLNELDRPVVVVIDDIDRLQVDGIQQVFRLVKSAADFPRTVYILAFDEEAVTRALNEATSDLGREYLNKIVQLPVRIPEPDAAVLRSFLEQKLKNVLEVDLRQLRTVDDRDWDSVYTRSIISVLRTLRDVKRYINGLQITYRLVRGEVHALDFLAIELIRIIVPSVYDAVAANSEIFAGGIPSYPPPNMDDRKKRYDEVLKKAPAHLQKPVDLLLQDLFPAVAALRGGPQPDISSEDGWRRERRICSTSFFPFYFQLAVPTGQISEADLHSLYEVADDPQRLREGVERLLEPARSGETRLARFYSLLQRIEDHPEHFKSSHLQVANFTQILLSIAEDFTREQWENLTDIDVIGAVRSLLDDIDEPARSDVLASAIEQSSSVYVALLLVHRLSEIPPKKQPYDVDRLKQTICQKIAGAAEGTSLARTPHLRFVKAKWSEWCPDGVARWRQFVTKLLQLQEGPAILLGNYLTPSAESPRPEGEPGAVYTIDLRELGDELGGRDEVNRLYERVALAEQQDMQRMPLRWRLGIETFCEEWRRAGSQVPGGDSTADL